MSNGLQYGLCDKVCVLSFFFFFSALADLVYANVSAYQSWEIFT